MLHWMNDIIIDIGDDMLLISIFTCQYHQLETLNLTFGDH